MIDIVIEKEEPHASVKEIVKEGLKSLYQRPLIPLAIFGFMMIMV